ncbi:MAG TPA: hypothetical protein VJO33_20200 [Gemmatimonadaceae bacterium]|nr:hypothetical protein [Gemmatimonadaceae bacterium]
MSRILVVTGGSGVGKTTIVDALDTRAIPGVQCFHFDSIGVPPPEVLEREYGGGENWQAAATADWLARLGGLPSTVHVAVLDAQTRPSFVFDASSRAAPRSVHVVLIDCTAEVRAARLRGPRQQPDLASPRMDSWAAYLRGQADALRLPIIDTSTLTVADATSGLETLVRHLVRSDTFAT